ncbi:MAG: alternative ribosome rescue aminoacyl-tRNA hydrolase ArfB [Actinomycetota bacterium]
MAGTDGEALRVTRTLAIPLAELSWQFTGAGGPGGQHANTANTKAEVRFDVVASAALGPRQRARLLERCGPVIKATASERRSQLRNRELALERLAARIAAALKVEAPRHATKPSAGARRRRVDDKRRRGETKVARRRPRRDEE